MLKEDSFIWVNAWNLNLIFVSRQNKSNINVLFCMIPLDIITVWSIKIHVWFLGKDGDTGMLPEDIYAAFWQH